MRFRVRLRVRIGISFTVGAVVLTITSSAHNSIRIVFTRWRSGATLCVRYCDYLTFLLLFSVCFNFSLILLHYLKTYLFEIICFAIFFVIPHSLIKCTCACQILANYLWKLCLWISWNRWHTCLKTSNIICPRVYGTPQVCNSVVL